MPSNRGSMKQPDITFSVPPMQLRRPHPIRWPGLLLTAALALVAMGLGHMLPLLGAPLSGVVLGVALRHWWTPGDSFKTGIRFASKEILQYSIIGLGFGLSFNQVAQVGFRSLSVTMVTMIVAAASAWLLGRVLGVSDKLQLLIGVGTAICGGSAIAAISPIVQPEESDTTLAISTIFLFNLLAVLLFPLLGHLLQLSDRGFGLWAGTAINDTSSVVAAGYTYSKQAGDYATIVKLTRATLIIPICVLLTAITASRRQRINSGRFELRRIVPWFILWFLLASVARSLGWVPAQILPVAHVLTEFLIVAALGAIGLSTDLRQIAASGLRPILLGLGTWVMVAASSLLMQRLTAQL